MFEESRLFPGKSMLFSFDKALMEKKWFARDLLVSLSETEQFKIGRWLERNCAALFCSDRSVSRVSLSEGLLLMSSGSKEILTCLKVLEEIVGQIHPKEKAT